MPTIRTAVYVELGSKRILGFAPSDAKPVFPPGTRYDTKIPFDTIELEKWIGKYRDQQQNDAEAQAYRQIQREQPFRDALKSAIRERNQHVNPFNRDLNNALMALMDREYDRIMRMRAKPEVFGVAEAYEESTSGEDVALEHPVFRS